ncbi:MAG: HAMP domain-containing histidine kinase, partial [Candidatus Obscuribacterales bacterium]|nr:HAMP domain-containing histidine kinase [Candidatus Obscuribacterales bacterium]
NIGNSEFYKAHAKSNQEQAIALNKHLKMLLKNEPSLVVPPLHLAAQWSGVGAPPGLDTGILRRQLEQLAKQQAKAALASMNLLQLMLWAGTLFSLVVTIVLAVFFCLNITNRLLIIMNNTVSLSKGSAPSPPIQGSDEIAELDQFLFKSATEIKELEKFKHQMIGVVSHELKSPLTSVGGFLSSLSEGVYGELPPKVKDKVGRTYNSVKRLMGLVKELLYLDRLELQMDPELIPVDEIIAASIDTVKELSEQYGIEIEVIKNDVQNVYADRNRLVQVIVNLLSNAMKFSPPQGKVTIETKQGDGIFECRVSDQGRGIPEDFRKQIFEPFKQVDSKDATTKKGTGLGLTISRSIVEQHGGTIGVDSVLGEGSTFWLRIPDSAKNISKSSKDSARNNLPSLKLPESTESSKSRTGKLKKFSVLQQGLVIISVPLIFQLVFVSVIATMLVQVGEQTKREQNAQELVNSLTRLAEGLLDSTQITVMYALTRDGRFKQALDISWNGTLEGLDHAKNSISDSEELKIIDECKSSLQQMTDVVERESAKTKTNGGFQKLIETGGWNLLMSSMIKEVGNDNIPGSAVGTTQIKTPGGEIIGQEMMVQMKRRFKECLVIGEPGLGALSALDRLM